MSAWTARGFKPSGVMMEKPNTYFTRAKHTHIQSVAPQLTPGWGALSRMLDLMGVSYRLHTLLLL